MLDSRPGGAAERPAAWQDHAFQDVPPGWDSHWELGLRALWGAGSGVSMKAEVAAALSIEAAVAAAVAAVAAVSMQVGLMHHIAAAGWLQEPVGVGLRLGQGLLRPRPRPRIGDRTGSLAR